MDWATYKKLCDQPEYWSRWMLLRSAQLMEDAQQSDLATRLREVTRADPGLSKPPDHHGPDTTDMFRLHLPPQCRQRVLKVVQAAAGQDPQRYRGFEAAWREYAASAES